MHRLRTGLTIILAACLGGCFISEAPLIGADDAAFPYEAISYRQPNEEAPAKMVREGDSYVMTSPDGKESVDIRFKDIGDGLYLAQMSGEENGKVSTLYSVLKVDWEKKTAESYKAVAKMEEERPGLRKCGDSTLCIDDLDAYLTLAREAIATGKPDVTYEIVATE